MYPNTSHVFYQFKHFCCKKRNSQVFDKLSNDKQAVFKSGRQNDFELERKLETELERILFGENCKNTLECESRL